MKCPRCEKDGTRSTVATGATMSTCMGWSHGHYDEDGEWVAHPNPNWHTTAYTCSNGHYFDVVRREGKPDVVRMKGAGAGAGPCYRPPSPSEDPRP
jgi:hypothetical protein